MNRDPITRPRLATLIVGAIAAFFATWTFLNNFSAGVLPRWTPYETAIVAALGALGSAIFIVEFIRMFWASAATWSNGKHFAPARPKSSIL
jgi:hypothetical protein